MNAAVAALITRSFLIVCSPLHRKDRNCPLRSAAYGANKPLVAKTDARSIGSLRRLTRKCLPGKSLRGTDGPPPGNSSSSFPSRAGATISARCHPIASHWADRLAPTLDDFEALARHAFATLPETFRALVGDVTFAVAEFPEDDVLDDLDLESPFDLLGLFQGVGLAHASADRADRRDAEPHLALPPPDPRLLGRARRDAGARSSPMFSFMRSDTISDCRTTTWRRSRRPRNTPCRRGGRDASAQTELRMLRPRPAAGFAGARICTFECTFCADCVETVLGGVCPNCGGNLVPRPIRPAELAKYPASTERVRKEHGGCPPIAA